MPTIAEKARAEAEQAEAEDQEEQPDQDGQSNGDEPQEPAVEPHPGDGLEEPSDAMVAELQAACDEHHDRVHAIMGPFVEGWTPCETCNGIGIAYPIPAKPRLNARQGAVECTVCSGYGELELPTKRDQFKVEMCTNCAGKGWVGQGNMPNATPTQQTVESFPAEPGATITPMQPQQPASTDPRVEELRAAGYIVLEKPNN